MMWNLVEVGNIIAHSAPNILTLTPNYKLYESLYEIYDLLVYALSQ